MVGPAFQNRRGDVGFALLVGARNDVVDIGFRADRQIVTPEVGELDLSGAFGEREDEIEKFPIHGRALLLLRKILVEQRNGLDALVELFESVALVGRVDRIFGQSEAR